SAYPMTRFPSPLTAPLVDPDPETICTLTAANSTVGLPPTPADTYVGASTAVVPAPHEGEAPVPPETTACPAIVGTHSQPGVTAASAAEAAKLEIAAAIETMKATRTIGHFSPLPVPPVAGRHRASIGSTLHARRGRSSTAAD